MKWLQGMIGTAETTIAQLDVTMARDAADIHASTFGRGWTDGEITSLIHQANTLGYAAHQANWTGAGPAPLVGFVLARGAADEAEILTIGVRPDWQGYGVGRRLMDHVLAHAHRERLQAVFLEVEETNRRARALYDRLGFTPVGDRPGYYGGSAETGRSAIIMRRSIGQSMVGR